jgi:hypothetical protein
MADVPEDTEKTRPRLTPSQDGRRESLSRGRKNLSIDRFVISSRTNEAAWPRRNDLAPESVFAQHPQSPYGCRCPGPVRCPRMGPFLYKMSDEG